MIHNNSEANDLEMSLVSSDGYKSCLQEIRERRLALTSGGSGSSSSSGESKTSSQYVRREEIESQINRLSCMNETEDECENPGWQNPPRNAEKTAHNVNVAKEEAENTSANFRHDVAESAEDQIANIQATVTSLTTTLTATQTELTSIQYELDQLQQYLQTIQTIQTERTTHQTGLNVAHDKISTLERENNSLSQQVASRDESIARHLKEKAKLQAQVLKWMLKAQVNAGAVDDKDNVADENDEEEDGIYPKKEESTTDDKIEPLSPKVSTISAKKEALIISEEEVQQELKSQHKDIELKYTEKEHTLISCDKEKHRNEISPPPQKSVLAVVTPPSTYTSTKPKIMSVFARYGHEDGMQNLPSTGLKGMSPCRSVSGNTSKENSTDEFFSGLLIDSTFTTGITKERRAKKRERKKDKGSPPKVNTSQHRRRRRPTTKLGSPSNLVNGQKIDIQKLPSTGLKGVSPRRYVPSNTTKENSTDNFFSGLLIDSSFTTC